MLKVTYNLKTTFSLKNMDDGHLMARSHNTVTRSTVRGAIIASAFKYKGKKWTEEVFDRINCSLIFIQKPMYFSNQQEKRRLINNNALGGLKSEPKHFEDVDSLMTVGIREFVILDEVVFYIDETIPDIVELLSNITRLGNSESLVSLKSITKADRLENVYVDSETFDYKKEYIYDEDWHKATFNTVYAYDKKYKHTKQKVRCELIPKLTL